MIIFELYLMEDFFFYLLRLKVLPNFFLLLNIVGIGYYIIGMVIFHWFQFYFCVRIFFRLKVFLVTSYSINYLPVNVPSISVKTFMKFLMTNGQKKNLKKLFLRYKYRTYLLRYFHMHLLQSC